MRSLCRAASVPSAVLPIVVALASFTGPRDARAAGAEGRYLDQPAPGKVPERFAPRTLDSLGFVFAPAFAPDGREVYLCRMEAGGRFTIQRLWWAGGAWRGPERAVFSTGPSDGAPCVAPGGRRLYFDSTRPVPGLADSAGRSHLWYVDRAGRGWSAPRPVRLPIASSGLGERYPSLARDGTLYFCADFGPEHGGGGIHSTREVHGAWEMPLSAGPGVNRPGTVVVEPCVAPGREYLVFYSAGGTDNLTPGKLLGDLYVSFRRPDGAWGESVNLGPPVNSTGEENFARLSGDGRFLFFSNDRAGFPPRIHWVDAQVVREAGKPAR